MQSIGDHTDSSYPSVACMDFNDPNAAIIAGRFARIGYIMPLKTGPHSTGNGDFCAYYMANETTSAKVTTLTEYHTDHWPVLFSWHLNGH